MLTNEIKVINDMVLFQLDITLWTARKKLHAGDINAAVSALPPEELASLGSKRIAPADRLKVFSALRARASSLLDRHGIRFLSGWLVPKKNAADVRKALDDMKDEFDMAKDAFLADYDATVQSWLAGHEEWRGMIEQAVEPADTVRGKLRFGYHSFKIVAAGADSNIRDEVTSLGDTVFADIAKQAGTIWNEVLEGRTSVTHKALGPLRSLHAKLEGLTFVEPHVAPVAALIHAAIQRLPAKGNIDGMALAGLQGIVCLLRDQKALIRHASHVLNGYAVDSVLDGLTPPEMVAMPTAGPVHKPAEREPLIPNSAGLW